MKKSILPFLASALLISGVSTEALANKTTIHQDYLQKGAPSAFNYSLKAFTPAKKKREITRVVDRSTASDVADLAGTWTFIVGDNYLEGGKGYVAVEFEATVEDGNMVTFTNPDYYPLKAKYNAYTHSVFFKKTQVGTDGERTVYQEPFFYDSETGKIKKRGVLGYFNHYQRAIVFDDNLGIALTAYNDNAGKDQAGYYDLLDFTVCYLPMGGEWTDIEGKATFTDAWLTPALLETDAEATYQVPVQRSADNENIYRLVNPYKYGPMAYTNECDRDGYIVFDVTNPEHVMFKFADSGYSNKNFRIDNFFVYNYIGSLMLINPYYSPEEVIIEFGNDFPASTYKDGIVEFDMSMERSDVRFALNDLANSPRFWTDSEGRQVKKKVSIILPEATGVNNNLMEEAEADTEYYNTQGLRVVNPEPGQIVIKRQGNVVTKEVVR